MPTVIIGDAAHKAILRKQFELKDKYKISIKIADLTNIAILQGINKVEEEIGLKIQQQKQ